MNTFLKLTNVFLIILLSKAALLINSAAAQGYEDPDAVPQEDLPLVRCIQPLSSPERAIYCAKQHSADSALPQEDMSFTATEIESGWVITQSDNSNAEQQWRVEITESGELISIQ